MDLNLEEQLGLLIRGFKYYAKHDEIELTEKIALLLLKLLDETVNNEDYT